MTEFFHYDEMTWDAVAALPRDTPLVLPLGWGYDFNALAGQLSHPAQIGLLPLFPFGWRRSWIAVPEPILFQYISNLLDSLRDDGFSRVYCLAPQGLDPQSFFNTSARQSFLTLPNWKRNTPIVQLPPDSERGKVILIPIGHTEQHGFHLPLSTDTIIIDAIAQGTCVKLPTRTFTLRLHTSGKIGAAALEKYRTSPIGGMGHAGELETSYLLHLRPDLCHMERVVDETDFVATPDYYMDWIEGGSLIANPPWDDDTKTGAYGAGSHATAEKGRLWLEAAIEEKAAHVEEIHLQHEMREKRRNEGYGLWGKYK